MMSNAPSYHMIQFFFFSKEERSDGIADRQEQKWVAMQVGKKQVKKCKNHMAPEPK